MPRFHRAQLAGWILFALAAPAIASATVLRSADLQQVGSKTVVTLQFDAKPQAKLFSLSRPGRAVLDLKGATRGPGLRWPEAAGAVAKFRSAPLAGAKGMRVVLELADGARAPRQRYLAPAGGAGHRLLIELTTSGASSTAPLASSPVVAANTIQANNPATANSPALPIRPEHAPAETGRDIVVAVDAGHGGQDPGATGKRGTYEKDVVLAIARLLAEQINGEPGMRAVLTRDGDYFLPLRERIARARRARADLFVSVHADAVRDREVSGASVYVLSEKGASDEQARWLADQENAADLKGGIPLDDKSDTLASVLLDLSQSASIAESMRAAERVLQKLGKISDVRKPRVQQAGFVVLKSPDIPSMLVETAYISNPRDEADLSSQAHRERIAAAIVQGVRQYFSDRPPDGTRFALERRHGAGTTAAR